MMEDNGQVKTYYQCRYYDDVFGQWQDFKIPTSQTRDKVQKAKFKRMVLDSINNMKADKKWPHSDRLTVAVSISGLESYINRIDIDNVLKNLLDILKGIVYIDDKQIFSIMAEKHVSIMNGFLVAIRVLKPNEFNETIPPFFCGDNIVGFGPGPTTFWKALEIREKKT